jgi:hypothetical protein
MKHHDATIIGVVLIPAHTLKRAALETVHCAPVIQTVNQIVQLFRERYT